MLKKHPFTGRSEPDSQTEEIQPEAPESSVPEFSVDEVPAEGDAAAEAQEANEAASPWPTSAEASEEVTVESVDNEFAVVDESTEVASTSEIDLSSEWDDSVSVETDEPAAEVAEAEVAEPEVTVPEVASAVEEHEASSGKVEETIEEIRFYLAHGMPEQAMAGLAKLQTDQRSRQAGPTSRRGGGRNRAARRRSSSREQQIEELTSDDIPSVEVAVEEPVKQPPSRKQSKKLPSPWKKV